MGYILKHFDKEIVRFELESNVIEGLSAKIIAVSDQHLPFKPIDLELSDHGLLTWLRRRVIPSNRAFVQSFLAKLGLNVNDTKGIIDLCKGLSLNDCYWVVDDAFEGRFDRYNLYENPLRGC